MSRIFITVSARIVQLTVRLILFFTVALLAACAPPQAVAPVARQNQANVIALARNVDLLSALAQAGARRDSDLLLHSARDSVADDLTQLRILILSDALGAPELADPDAPFARQALSRAAALRARLTLLPLDQRDRALDSLASSSAAVLDLALQTPGFDPSRLARDALAVDALNVQLAAERDALLRDALLTRRDTILDAYTLPRRAAARAESLRTSTADLIAAVNQQTRTAHLHAAAIAGFSSPSSPPITPESLYRSQDLRDAVTAILRESRGEQSAADFAARLNRLDHAMSRP